MARLKDSSKPDGRSRSDRKGLRTVRAMSAGGIVVRRGDDGPQLVLGSRRRERDGTTWTLPKGTPHPGETVEQTALREVTEETGLDVSIVSTVGAIDYWFVQDGTRIHKTVHYFLMRPTGGDLSRHDHEFDEVRWVETAAAESMLSFPTERDIVSRAAEGIEELGRA